MLQIRGPYYRRLVAPGGYRHPMTPIISLGETTEEQIERLKKEMSIFQAREAIEGRAAFSDAQLAQIQKQEKDMLRKMQSDMKSAMIRMAATQLAFDAALNAIPVAGMALSVIFGKISKAGGEHYKRKAQRDVTVIQLEMEKYKAARMKLVDDALSKVYDQEFPYAERAAIALISEQVSAIPAEMLAGLDGWLSSFFKNPFKAIKDVITGFVDDISGQSSYDAAIKQAKAQQTKANKQIKELTERQIVETKSNHGRSIMRASIVNMLVKSPQFKRLAELMLNTRRERLKAAKKASLGKKIAIGVGVAALAYGVSKAL